jgi:hypothetical protein
MKLQDFIRFVLANEKYPFQGKLAKVANAVRTLAAEGEDEITYEKIANKAKLKLGVVGPLISDFTPEEVAQENIEKAVRKSLIPKPIGTSMRGDQATKQVENALGEAYVTGIKQIASKYSWYGEIVTEIGNIALLGYLMSVNIGPDEIGEFLNMFKNPKELVDAFKDYYTYLLKFSVGASEMQTVIQELNDYKLAFEYLKKVIASYKHALAEQQQLNGILAAVTPREKLEQAMSAWALTRQPVVVAPVQQAPTNGGEKNE